MADTKCAVCRKERELYPWSDYSKPLCGECIASLAADEISILSTHDSRLHLIESGALGPVPELYHAGKHIQDAHPDEDPDVIDASYYLVTLATEVIKRLAATARTEKEGE